ncbi:MAG: DNA methyltransferase [Candidatus Bathyarchaeota archaeon]|nr:DNA methyltransferase [Candidatus Bathyarchaeota archaeon]
MGTRPKEINGFIFACTNSTQNECFERLLFGNAKPNGAVAIRVKQGDFLFLLNLEADLLYGIFRATTEGKLNIVPEAWSGNYPYQVRVEPIGKIVPLLNAKRLLKEMGLSRNSIMGKNATQKLADYFKTENSLDSWKTVSEESSNEIEIAKPREWSHFGKAKDVSTDVEEMPILQATTMWDFPRQSYGKTPKGNNKYAGVTPAELIWNLVWRYTEPNDLVVDPMCGSGTTIDVCNEEKRRVIGYDISPTRPDIIKSDARKLPLPDDTKAKLVFIDSPYGDNIKYNNEPANIGNISSENELFYDELKKVMDESFRILDYGGVIGWLIGDQWVKKKFTPVGFKIYQKLLEAGFETLDIICINRRGQYSHTAPWFNRTRRFNFYLRGFKYLFIMRKPDGHVKKEMEERKVSWAYYERNKDGKNKRKDN